MPCNFTGIIHFQLPETVVCFPRHAPQSMHLSWGFLSFHLFPEICPRLSAAQVGGMGVIGRITPLITWTRNVVVVLQLFFFPATLANIATGIVIAQLSKFINLETTKLVKICEHEPRVRWWLTCPITPPKVYKSVCVFFFFHFHSALP